MIVQIDANDPTLRLFPIRLLQYLLLETSEQHGLAHSACVSDYDHLLRFSQKVIFVMFHCEAFVERFPLRILNDKGA